MKVVMLWLLLMSAQLPAEDFAYDKNIALGYASSLAKDIVRLDMPDYSGEFDFSNADVYSIVDKKGRKFVFVSFLPAKTDGFFLIVTEICGFDGLGLQRYSFADYGIHAGDPAEFRDGIKGSQKDSDLDIPVGCPAWFTEREFTQP